MTRQKKPSEYNSPPKIVPEEDKDAFRLFDIENPDINLFNSIDDELIKVAGSELHVFKYEQDDDYDTLYNERRDKAYQAKPVTVYGQYDPRAIEENLTEFGIEITNDQFFTFNKDYLLDKLKRKLLPGDLIKPVFQNVYYEVFEVQEDRFDVYGVYHLVASARIFREAEKVFPITPDPS